MKKSLIILAICLCSKFVSAQTKTIQPAAKPIEKPKYTYFVVIPIQDYQQIFGALNDYKSLQMYNPGSDDKVKVATFKAIEAYLKELPTRIKVDSTLLKK